MTKYREITNISRVTDMILIYRKQRYLKRRSDTIPIISISAIYHGIFRYIDPPLMHWLTSIDGLNFIQIGPPAAKIWRLINFQDGSRGGALLLPVSYLMMLHSAKGQNLSANQISSTYLNSRLRCKYFRFGKKNKRPPYWNSISGFVTSVIDSWDCQEAVTLLTQLHALDDKLQIN